MVHFQNKLGSSYFQFNAYFSKGENTFEENETMVRALDLFSGSIINERIRITENAQVFEQISTIKIENWVQR